MRAHWLVKTSFALGILAAATASAGPEYISIQERAQGQSLAGASLLNDSLYTNPASSSFTQVYSVAADFMSAKTFGVSVLDTKTSEMGGAVGYFRTGLPPTLTNANPFMQGAKAGISGRFSNTIGFGLAGKLIYSPDPQGVQRSLTDLDAGLLANLDFLSVGLTLRNLFGGNVLVANQVREAALGARINYKNSLFFSVFTETTLQTFKLYQYGFGAEYVSPYYFSLKGGYYFQPGTNIAAWSTGLSILSPRVSFHYAVDFPATGSGAEHQVGMTLLF